MTHAMLLGILDTGGVWSVARGLARRPAVKDICSHCDSTRRNVSMAAGTSARKRWRSS